MNNLIQQDLDAIFATLSPIWPQLAGANLYVTGGTGFIGRWLLESLVDANHRLNLGVTATVLTRDPARFAALAPSLASDPALRFVPGDVLRLASSGERYSHVIHAATDASADLNLNDPRKMFDTVLSGTRNALDLAVASGAGRFFFLSSGAVYGVQPPHITHVGEDWLGAPDPAEPKNAYAEAKRAAEMLCAIYAKQFGVDTVTARIFALLGPLLNLDIHFAAGNFIRDAMAGRRITVEGAGGAVRSYLYVADLTAWLWTILLTAPAGGIYNCGSEEAVSIADLARRVAALLGAPGVDILGRPDPGWNPGRYVPSSARIRNDLGVAQSVALDEAIRCTAAANGWNE